MLPLSGILFNSCAQCPSNSQHPRHSHNGLIPLKMDLRKTGLSFDIGWGHPGYTPAVSCISSIFMHVWFRRVMDFLPAESVSFQVTSCKCPTIKVAGTCQYRQQLPLKSLVVLARCRMDPWIIAMQTSGTAGGARFPVALFLGTRWGGCTQASSC